LLAFPPRQTDVLQFVSHPVTTVNREAIPAEQLCYLHDSEAAPLYENTVNCARLNRQTVHPNLEQFRALFSKTSYDILGAFGIVSGTNGERAE
jgi:hypothetical protein